MKKVFATILLSVFIVFAFVGFSIPYTPRAQVATEAQVFPKPQVGIFYYVWYDTSSEESWNPLKIVDQPVLGKYDSSDPAIIRKHLISMEELGVDFVVISWWGVQDDYGRFTDEAARHVFENAQSINSPLKFAVMVEPLNMADNSYDYKGIYNHVYETFAEPYSEQYYNLSGKPLICFFNNENLTDNGDFPQDEKSRFSVISVGQKAYTLWIYTNLNEHDSPLHGPRGQISVTPRFDDSRYRTPSCIVDPNLTEGVYDQEWKNAIHLLREGKIDTIMISSWNEYVERTQIEPHYDGTSNKPPDFLYDKTRDYIIKANYEINVHIHGEDYNNFTLSHLSDLGVTWVRMDYEKGITEEMMTDLHQAGYKVLAIIDNRTAPFSTLEEWNNTLLSIVSDPVYQLIDGWEIWNEPNSIDGAYIDPSDYREMLRCAYGILKNSTEILIISGGLAPHENFSTYLNETFKGSDISSYYDYFGLHLYNETIPQNMAYIEEAEKVTGKEIWITEIGRPSQTEVFTEENQASYLVENIKSVFHKVEEIFVYELYDYDYTGKAKLTPEKEKYFGLLTKEYDKKPVYIKLKELRLVEGTVVKPWYENPIILIMVTALCVVIALLIRQAHLSRRLKT